MKLSPARTVLALLWVVLAAAVLKHLCAPIYDPDLWWHLAAGREMAARGAVLKEEIFSHTLPGSPWLNFEWLAQIVLHRLHDVFGAAGIYAGKALAGAAAWGLLIACCRAAGARGIFLWSLAAAGFAVLRIRLFERTELATLILLPLFLWTLLKARSLAPPLRRRVPWALAALMVLWCNLHAGFVYGVGLPLLLGLGARWSKQSASYVQLLDRAFAFALAAALVNPYGPRLMEIFVEVYFQMKDAPGVILEWSEPSVRLTPFFWGLFVVAAAALGTGLFRRDGEARFWAPAVAAFAVNGSAYYRSTSLLAFTALPFLAAYLGPRMSRFPKAAWVLAAFLSAVPAAALKGPFPAKPVKENWFPSGAARFVRQQGIEGTLYNPYEYGGYLSWAWGPERKIFMDGRYLFYEFLLEMDRLVEVSRRAGAGPWQKYFKRHGVDYAVVYYFDLYPDPPGPGRPHHRSPLDAMFPDGEWALVFWDDASLVFLKRTPAREEFIRRMEYVAASPYNLEKMEHRLRSGEADLSRLRAELDRHEKEIGPSRIRERLRALLN